MTTKVVAILGLGLIGGSLGLALRRYGPANLQIIGWDKDSQAVSRSIERQAIDHAVSDWQQLQAADFIFLCTPMLQIIPLAKLIIPYVKAGAIITDVGSVKGSLAVEMTRIVPADIYYIGGHPIAGREKSGIEAAEGDLFINKWYILAPPVNCDAAILALLQEVICFTGAKVTVMKPERHDVYAAAISHLPHVAAAGLVNTIGLYGEPDEMLELAGGGFRDTTRIASSNSVMWTDICLTNKTEILVSIKKYQQVLNKLATAIEQQDREEIALFFTGAKARRDQLLENYDKKTCLAGDPTPIGVNNLSH
jgi:prephenate dehydrogenase